jgi:predicted transcriptional regulator
MSNESIIKELEDQMASAAFQQQVEEHLDSMDITVLLVARLGRIPSDVLVAVLAAIICRLLVNECPDDARVHYADLVKRLIDEAIQLSNKE